MSTSSEKTVRPPVYLNPTTCLGILIIQAQGPAKQTTFEALFQAGASADLWSWRTISQANSSWPLSVCKSTSLYCGSGPTIRGERFSPLAPPSCMLPSVVPQMAILPLPVEHLRSCTRDFLKLPSSSLQSASCQMPSLSLLGIPSVHPVPTLNAQCFWRSCSAFISMNWGGRERQQKPGLQTLCGRFLFRLRRKPSLSVHALWSCTVRHPQPPFAAYVQNLRPRKRRIEDYVREVA